MRERWPRTGKHKLMLLLKRQGLAVSESMVGRVLTRAKHKGLLREPHPHSHLSTPKRRLKRPYAIRKPKGYSAIKRPLNNSFWDVRRLISVSDRRA